MTTEELRRVYDALETAYGCLDLMLYDRKPRDLSECLAEVAAARDLVSEAFEAAAP